MENESNCKKSTDIAFTSRNSAKLNKYDKKEIQNNCLIMHVYAFLDSIGNTIILKRNNIGYNSTNSIGYVAKNLNLSLKINLFYIKP